MICIKRLIFYFIFIQFPPQLLNFITTFFLHLSLPNPQPLHQFPPLLHQKFLIFLLPNHNTVLHYFLSKLVLHYLLIRLGQKIKEPRGKFGQKRELTGQFPFDVFRESQKDSFGGLVYRSSNSEIIKHENGNKESHLENHKNRVNKKH